MLRKQSSKVSRRIRKRCSVAEYLYRQHRIQLIGQRRFDPCFHYRRDSLLVSEIGQSCLCSERFRHLFCIACLPKNLKINSPIFHETKKVLTTDLLAPYKLILRTQSEWSVFWNYIHRSHVVGDVLMGVLEVGHPYGHAPRHDLRLCISA
jgi:hypothetical protein